MTTPMWQPPSLYAATGSRRPLARGGSTSLAGQGCNTSLVLDFCRHMNAIIEIDVTNRTATVQPGVVPDDLRAAVAKRGLTFGPDPASHDRLALDFDAERRLRHRAGAQVEVPASGCCGMAGPSDSTPRTSTSRRPSPSKSCCPPNAEP